MAEVKKDWEYYKTHFGTLEELVQSLHHYHEKPNVMSLIGQKNVIPQERFENFEHSAIAAALYVPTLDEVGFGVEAIKKRLGELGLQKLKAFSTGGNALILGCANGKLIRISPSEGEASDVSKSGFRGGKPMESSAILQPIQTFKIDDIQFSILPEIQCAKEEVSLAVKRSLLKKLADEGFYYEDDGGFLSSDNVGYLPDDENTPVIIDIDSVIHFSEVAEEHKEKIALEMNKYKGFNQAYDWELPDGTWKQHQEFPQIWNSGKPEAGQVIGDDGVARRLVELVENAETMGKSSEVTRVKGK